MSATVAALALAVGSLLVVAPLSAGGAQSGTKPPVSVDTGDGMRRVIRRGPDGPGGSRPSGADFALPAKPVPLPKTLAGRRLGEFLAAIELTNDDDRRAFIKNSLSDSMLAKRGGPDRSLRMLNQLHANEEAFVVTKIEKSAEHEISALATSKKEGIPFRFEIKTEPATPHKIVGISINTLGPVERD